MLPHIIVPLTQQKIMMQAEALEIAMKLEASPIGETGIRMAQIQHQLANLTLQLWDMKKWKEVREEVWCIKCNKEGHHKDQCPLFQEYLATVAPNPLNHGAGPWCKICRTRGGHRPKHCPLLQKYVSTLTRLYFSFCKSIGHDESSFRAYNMMHNKRTYMM